MELELEQELMPGYELAGHSALCQEETLEAIVPDACPDILRLVDVCGQVFVIHREVKEESAEVSGSVQAVILYAPEQGGQLCRMEVLLPFFIRTEVPGGTGADCAEVWLRLKHADARILNPRKVLVRVEVAADLDVFRKKEDRISSGVKAGEDGSLCQLRHQVEHDRLVCMPQRSFPLSEELRIAGTEGGCPELLQAQTQVCCTESRVIGSKLIFKGKLELSLLLQNGEGGVEKRVESIPFSQILEAKKAGDHCTGQVWLQLRAMKCELDRETGRLTLEGEMLAQGQIWQRDRTTLLTDLYSTTHHMEHEKTQLRLYAPEEPCVIPVNLRELLETEDVVRSICDCRLELGEVTGEKRGELYALTVHGRVIVRYLDEGRQLVRLEKGVELTGSIPHGGEGLCLYRVRCPGELFAAPCAGGIEVRLGVELAVRCAALLERSCICRGVPGISRDEDACRPSVVLRRPEPGETLWDIAKSCGTTTQQILQVNELTDEEIPAGVMLLIPGRQ